MRRWIKYVPVPVGARWKGTIDSFDDHVQQMGGYEPDRIAYSSKELFFSTYLFNSERRRACRDYLLKAVRREDRVLSVGSGRCANELDLQESIGCKVVCSDLGEPECMEATRHLFPNLEFVALDITAPLPQSMNGSFDVVISLSLIYALDDDQLEKLFAGVSSALSSDGRFILDLAGAPDNKASKFFHNMYIPFEARLVAFAKTVIRLRRHTVRSIEFGFRRTKEDVFELARRHSLIPTDYWEGLYHLDFMRSAIASRLIRLTAGKLLFSWLGQRHPYLRLQAFVKS